MPLIDVLIIKKKKETARELKRVDRGSSTSGSRKRESSTFRVLFPEFARQEIDSSHVLPWVWLRTSNKYIKATNYFLYF